VVTTTRFGTPDPQLDHLVYAVPDLAEAAARFTAVTGVEPAPGGRHLGRGTRNLLVGLGPAAYLEIIGPDPEQPADPGAVVPFGVDAVTAPRLVTWAAHPADLAAAVRASAAAGADLGEIAPMSRRTPDGELLSWRLAAPHPAPFDGVTPFVIDWGTTRHPAAAPALPSVLLRGLHATHPDPAGVGGVLAALGVDLPVEPGPPGLAALLDTPNGPVVLS
jgi:hypothetical protein